jgi:hypothetical protein
LKAATAMHSNEESSHCISSRKVSAIIDMGKSLKQCAIAEGIETEEQLSLSSDPALRGRTRLPLQSSAGGRRLLGFATGGYNRGCSPLKGH